MSNQQHKKFIKQALRDGLFYLLRGGMVIKNGHYPQFQHTVPKNFFGICVASNKDPAVDAYVIQQLKVIGINNVRLDFTYVDLDSFNERFLQALLAEKFNVTLHLLAPFNAAKNMLSKEEQGRWNAFLKTTLDRYGAQITQVEIGNTINRKRWAGYTINSFLSAWKVAHAEVKSRGITLLGPNIQDFEPMYNISILKTLQVSRQLPDVHTDNLFVERVSEPERFDHRILKYRWARVLKYNLIKKARLLQKIGQNFGVARTTSSAAFWAIYRIERLIENGEQKQADYLTRYFTLLAASGALQQANWGALICHREGLINDGLQDAGYPDLERIAHYQSADGKLSSYRNHASFYAMQTMIKNLSDTDYQAPIASTKGLEIHHFNSAKKQVHVAWAVNGKIAYLSDIYAENTLKHAKITHRDGTSLDDSIQLITETPLYLHWDKDFKIEVRTEPKLAKDLAIHAHIQNLQYFRFDQDGWQGLVLAKDAAEASLLMQALNPNHLQSPQKDQSLRYARNAIWAVEDPRNKTQQLTIKQPIKMYPHKAFLDRFKPSKAKRSWNGTMELLRRGIASAQPIAYFEKLGDNTLKQNFYICEYVKADSTIREIFSAFATGKASHLMLTPEEVYSQFAQFCHKMHSKGIHFRDLSGGNILVNILPNNNLKFSLIDTARLHSFTHSTAIKLRIADLTRACHKLHWEGRERFMQIYLGLSGRKFTWQYKCQFYLYDFKVKLKRTIGRRGIKKLIKRLKK